MQLCLHSCRHFIPSARKSQQRWLQFIKAWTLHMATLQFKSSVSNREAFSTSQNSSQKGGRVNSRPTEKPWRDTAASSLDLSAASRRSPDSPDKYCVPFLRGPSTVTPAVLAPFFAKDATPSTSALSSTARRAGPPKLGAARKQGDSDDDTSDSPKFQAAAKKIKRGPKEDKWPSLAPSS
ncbi:TPA: hypothetical protein ACH3X3_013022 [Trebouxia sp. C0006]